MNNLQIAPSILAADLFKLAEQVKIVENAGADMIHVDVMDGHFVPNITFGPVIVSALKRVTDLPLDVHLMISEPERYIQQFVDAGANILTVHQEAGPHMHRTLQSIKEAGIHAGVCINPGTNISSIFPILSEVYLVLIMSVNPGFGGQNFLPLAAEKIAMLAKYRDETNFNFLIEVDGGISPQTAGEVVSAGADILVAGNAIFGQSDIKSAFQELKKAANDALD
jgi:ribulose-phosphate 3-epimerase